MSSRTVKQGAVISVCRIHPHNFGHVRRSHRHIVAAGDPVLRAEVVVAQQLGRKLGHDVVGVRDAVVAAHVLVGDVVG